MYRVLSTISQWHNANSQILRPKVTLGYAALQDKQSVAYWLFVTPPPGFVLFW